MILLILLQLYTVPIVLKTLGIVDYGIYNVVGGVVTMFSFIGGALASGSQRFMAFALGHNDEKELKQTFDTIFTIYIFFAVISLLLLECAGTWFLNTQMNIPIERIYVANWVFQFSLLAFLVNLVSIPYNAVVIAHEKMSVFAYVSVLECVLKLLAAISLKYILYDRLILYSFFICVIAIIVRIIYQVYCVKKFAECKVIRLSWSYQTKNELLTYTSWNVIGSIVLLSRQQGMNIILNLFFGPVLNTAHSIAQQINSVLSQFINNINVAARPQIIKFYAIGNIAEMWSLIFSSAKYALFLLIYLSIPALLEMKTILNLWLGDVPRYTVEIARLMIITSLIDTLVSQVTAAYQAANKIRKYQLYSSTIIALNIPLSYILLKVDSESPLLPYIISIGLSILYVLSMLWNAHKEIQMDICQYCKRVILKVIIVFAFTIMLVFGFMSLFPPSLLRALVTTLNTVLCSSLLIWIIGLDKKEKYYIKMIINRKFFNR